MQLTGATCELFDAMLQARLMADPRASQMDTEDRKIVFAEFVKELEEKEIAAKTKEREARRQLEKAKKDELRAVLNAMVETTEVRRRSLPGAQSYRFGH